MGGHEQGWYVQAKLLKQAHWSRGEVRQKTQSLFGDAIIGDAEVFVLNVCERSDRARVVSSCRHRHRAYILLRACPKASSSKFQEDLELGDEGCVGQLQLSLYGTRDPTQKWAHEYTTFSLSLGFQVERASPCNFTHRTRRVHLTVHRDDFTVVASAKQIAWFGEAME